ncbi:MAG: DUF1080 domain-containing protein [Planctomycetaceae bacterium]
MRTMIAAGLLISAFSLTTHAEETEQWVKLFDGQTLEGWNYDDSYWSVQDEAITGQTTPDHLLMGYNTFCVLKDMEPANFQLRLKYKIVGGNSGVQYRSRVIDEKKWIVGGYQADIDSSPTYTGINYDERGRGILAKRGESVTIAADGTKSTIPFAGATSLQELVVEQEDWNDYLIVARGNHLQHFVNGVLMSEVIDHETEKGASKGVIALQTHAGPAMTVQFKDIELLNLD